MRGILLIGLFLTAQVAVCQKFIVAKSHVSFFSDAAIEDISAENEKTTGIFNSTTAEIVFSIPIKEFRFAKSLMQEHFNEKYMESEKYPKATFQGKLIDYHSEMNGTQEVKAAGKLTIHGITKEVELPGVVDTSGKEIMMKSRFFILLEDYQVTRPQLLWQNIAEKVEVTVEFTYKPM